MSIDMSLEQGGTLCLWVLRVVFLGCFVFFVFLLYSVMNSDK